MAFLFKSKKNHDRALQSREGPPGSQTSLQGASARVARNDKGSLERSTPTGSLNSVDNDGSLGSPDQPYGRQRGQSVDQQQQQPQQAQPPLQPSAQQPAGDLPVSSVLCRTARMRVASGEIDFGDLASKRTCSSITTLQPQCRPVSLVAKEVDLYFVPSKPLSALWRRRQFRLL